MCAMLSVTPYKGTRDFYPEEMAKRNAFFDVIRRVLQLHAFDEYGGPMLESWDLYAAKSGEEIADKQTYNFTDRGNRRLAIRPEMTPTVARMVAGKAGELNFPLRWFSIPNMYRYENPQRGRLREFWQLNVDMFGCDTYEADLEILSSAIDILKAYGADETMFTVHISNRRFFNDMMKQLTGKEELGKPISKIIDHKNKVPYEVYEKELTELGLSAEQIDTLNRLFEMKIEEAVALCPDSDGAKELTQLFDALQAMGLDKYCMFDFGIIRGLDYYTGTVFEVFDNAPENNRAMFGGGRYDNLVGMFVKNKISGVGYGMGDVTLENFLDTHHLLQKDTATKKVMITNFADVPYTEYGKLCDTLHEAGIRAMIYPTAKKFGKQIDYAVKENCTHIVTVGGTELSLGVCKLKDLATREEKEIPLGNLIEALNV